jgi:hypothetical protein
MAAKTKSLLDGDRTAAEKRMRKFTELAIQYLPTDALNAVAFTIAGHLNDGHANEMTAELHKENEKQRRRQIRLV